METMSIKSQSLSQAWSKLLRRLRHEALWSQEFEVSLDNNILSKKEERGGGGRGKKKKKPLCSPQMCLKKKKKKAQVPAMAMKKALCYRTH